MLEFGDDFRVGIGRGDDGDVCVIFSRRANHCGSADVYVFDGIVERDVRVFNCRLEGVEVDDEKINHVDAVLVCRFGVCGVVAQGEQAAVYARVQGFDATIHHFGEARNFGNIADGNTRVAQRACGSAGADDFDIELCERVGKFDEIGFVGDAQERAPNGQQIVCVCHVVCAMAEDKRFGVMEALLDGSVTR